MRRLTSLTAVASLTGASLLPATVIGCGLDWTLPTNHFDGVDEHGYVSYWEKIGEIRLDDGLAIPININFNSHREASSPYLGKGWMVALLESHVEPLDENNVKVIMPDGWNFYFRRDGNSETWRGNAGWVGETKNSIFRITAPCGWSILYEGGKIQEMDGSTGASFTFHYNGPVARELDINGKPRVVVEYGADLAVPTAVRFDDQEVKLSQAARPKIGTVAGHNLITGFDASLSQLVWPEGKTEVFTFGTDHELTPTLSINFPDHTTRYFSWDPTSRQIKSDGTWAYQLVKLRGHLQFNRISSDGLTESYEADDTTGLTVEKNANGNPIATYRFPSGPLRGQIRKIEERANGTARELYTASYFPSGRLMREIFYPDKVRVYSEAGKLLKETIGKQVTYEQQFDAGGNLLHIKNPLQDIEVKRTYDSRGNEITQVFRKGTLFYTETADSNHNLTSFTKGNP